MKELTTEYEISSSHVDCRMHYKASALMCDMQEAANKHASAIGFGYGDLIKDNCVWVISRIKARFLRAPLWEEKVRMTTWHKGMEGIFSLRDFEVRSAADGSVLAAATSSWLIMDVASRKLIRADHLLQDKGIATMYPKNALEPTCGKLRTPAGCSMVSSRTVHFSDTDFNMHTNNSRYIDWALDCIGADILKSGDIDEYQINFNHETVPGDTVDMYMAEKEGNGYFIEGRKGDTVIFQTIIKFR